MKQGSDSGNASQAPALDAAALAEPRPYEPRPYESRPYETHQNEVRQNEVRQYRWYNKLIGLLAVIFCFELGVFLLVFPWASDWDLNYFSSMPLWAANIWVSPFFRGAISGIGVLNIYVSFLEVFRLRRFSAPPSSLS